MYQDIVVVEVYVVISFGLFCIERTDIDFIFIKVIPIVTWNTHAACTVFELTENIIKNIFFKNCYTLKNNILALGSCLVMV